MYNVVNCEKQHEPVLYKPRYFLPALLHNFVNCFVHISVKRPEKQSDERAYRLWIKQQDESLCKFQIKWFEVVLKQRGLEPSTCAFGAFEPSEKALRKKTSLREGE